MKANSLRHQGIGLMGAIVVQYLLGMATNLYVTFPENAKPDELWQFAGKQPALAAHMLLGFVIFFGSAALLVTAIKAKNRGWIIAASVGFGFILLAAVAGSQFVSTQSDVYSFVMAASTAGALIAYACGVYQSRK